MYLKKLEIQGFKSFANKGVLEFPDAIKDDKGITAIVGPNGSGKSNTSDAIRWVLGEQSMKTLRGKKSSDLIFSGSSKKSRLGFAEVSLHLDNSDNIAPIDYDEIVITRRLYRSGESEYLLNKKTVRLADILMLLAKAKFAQKTYSVIGQGTIDSILVAPPNERKEFFDEAAGVKEYQIKRDKSLNRLKNTQKNLSQVDLMLTEIEPRLRSLTRQVKRLERREEVEKKLRDNQIQYYSSLVNEINKKIEKVKLQENEILPQFEQLKAELFNLQKNLDEAAIQETRSEMFSQLQIALSKFVSKKNGLLREQAILKGKLDVEYAKSGQINLVWLEKRKDEVKQRISELTNQLKYRQESIPQTGGLVHRKSKLENIDKEIETLKLKINKLSLGGDKLEDDEVKDILREILEEQKKFIEDFKKPTDDKDFETLIQEFINLKKQAEKIYEKISNFREKFVSSADTDLIANEIEQTQNTLSILQQEKNDLLSEINELNVVLQVSEEKKKLLEQEIERETTEYEKIKEEISQALNTSQDQGSKEEIKKKAEEKNARLEKEIEIIEENILDVQHKIDDFNSQEEKKKATLISLQREFSDKQTAFHRFTTQLNDISVNMTRLTTKKENILEDVKADLGDENLLTKDTDENTNKDALYNQIQQLKHQLELIGGIDEEVVKEYEQIKERYEFMHSQSSDLKEGIISLEDIIVELDKTITKEFNSSFNQINKEFDKYFKILFNGGKAKLVKITQEQMQEPKTEKELALEEIQKEKAEAEDKEETKENQEYDIKKKFQKVNIYAGIDIQACPPDKKINNINMLSGGEKALTAIALVCAIISCNPSPFVVLDEVDAALDEANSERFASILFELSHKTQFITITHNRSTMHQAKVLYGVTMGEDGVSRLLSVKLEDAEKMRDEGKIKLV